MTAVCLLTLSGGTALANRPLDLDVSFQKYADGKSAWGFLDTTSTSSRAWKRIYLFGASERSTEILAKLNPSLDYCCTVSDWDEKAGLMSSTKEVHASDITCKAYPSDGTHSVVHEENSGCLFRSY